MAGEIVEASGQPLADITHLEEWHARYIAAESDYLDDEARITLLGDVKSDPIDETYIEERIALSTATTHVSGRFCNDCVHLFSHWPDLGTKSWAWNIGRSFSTSDLEAAAREGCQFCLFLVQQLKDGGVLDTFRRLEARLERLKSDSKIPLSISNWSDDESQILWLNFPGKKNGNCNSWWAQQTEFQSRVVLPSFYIETPKDRFDIAKKWLQDCSEEHEHCKDVHASERPSRLVCIAKDDVKLVTTADWNRMPRYATLSYCWGTVKFPTLTTENFNIYCQGIPLKDLPKTFQDATFIARKLDIQYIWIDALCIIQRSKGNRDWLRESGLMRSVYGGSHVNIAAASATGVHEGCFSMPADFCGGLLARVETKHLGRVRNFYSRDVYERSTNESHLASRAWSLQEKLLAPRTVSIGDQGLFWECRTTIASEFLPDGFPGKLGSKMVIPPQESWHWDIIVRRYSQANLTNTSDKLPALAGIARRQHEVEGGEYLAGMWRKRLEHQLGWDVFDKRPRPEWRAPSWSWTSVDGGVAYWSYWNHEDVAQNVFVEVIDAFTTLLGPDPFGSVTYGELKLACSAMLRGSLHMESGKDMVRTFISREDETTETVETFDFLVYLDSTHDDSLQLNDTIFLLPLFSGDSGTARLTSKTRGQDQQTGDSTIPETTEDTDEENWTTELLVRGIVLQQDAEGCFRRLGAFDYRSLESRDNDAPPEVYFAFMRAVEEVGTSVLEEVSGDVRANPDASGEKYAITIV